MKAVGFDSWRLARRGAPPAGELSGVTVLEVGSARLRVQDIGAGPPIVIVPDPPNVIEHHASLNLSLAATHRVVCFEAPGFGYSRPGRDFAFTLAEQATTLVDVLDALDLRNVTLSLSCIGAYAAVVAATLRPERVERLVLSQIAGLPEMKSWLTRVGMRGIVGTPWVGQAVLAAMPRRVAVGWYQIAASDVCRPEYTRLTTASLDRGAAFSLASAFQAFAEADSPQPPTQPVDLLWGDADRSHRRDDPRSALAFLPHARVHIRAGCAHFPDIEAPEAFIELINAPDAGGR